MRQPHTLTYFISLFFLLFQVHVNAQNDNIGTTEKDSLVMSEKYGLRLGGDVGKIVRSFFDDQYKGFEIMGDFRLNSKLYVSGELGFEEQITKNTYLDITSTGSYFKGGIDYNTYENWLDMDNMIYFGFRLGASAFKHDLNEFTIYSTNQYWAPQLASTDNRGFENLNAFWSEVILGMKVELLKNIFLGANVQLKLLLNESSPSNFENVYIPGFGKTYDSSNIGAGYSYFLSYRIPLYQKTK